MTHTSHPRSSNTVSTRVGDLIQGIGALCAGLFTTFKHLFRPPVTEQYPEYKRQLPARSRARIILTRDPDGGERCVACYLCSAVCPVSCISMQSAEGPNGRRYAQWFRINFARCIYCGFCEEACPTLAIQLTADYETCQKDILKLLSEKEDLLVDHCGKNVHYNYYKYAGVAVCGDKGACSNENPPINLKSNLP
jgi:NADH-quinone oxidoreductase subunit I